MLLWLPVKLLAMVQEALMWSPCLRKFGVGAMSCIGDAGGVGGDAERR